MSYRPVVNKFHERKQMHRRKRFVNAMQKKLERKELRYYNASSGAFEPYDLANHIGRR